MDGMRDTEIAMGAYQHGHTLHATGGRMPRGQVAGFRLALWKEHIGVSVVLVFSTYLTAVAWACEDGAWCPLAGDCRHQLRHKYCLWFTWFCMLCL